MCIITLTTDFNTLDYSVGALKGHIYNLIPNARIVDISHHIAPFDMVQTAYMLKNAYIYFPENTIHIIGVDNELSPQKKLLVMKHRNQFFISADNGFCSIFNENFTSEDIYYIQTNSRSTFPTLLSVQVAQFIIQNQFSLEGKLPKIENFESIKSTLFPKPMQENEVIIGKIIYFDAFQNIVSNISHHIINKNKKFTIYFGSEIFNDYSFEKILNQYNEIENQKIELKNKKNTEKISYDGEKMLLFNHSGFLELALYKGDSLKGGAATLLNGSIKFRLNDSVRIKYLP